MAGRKKRVATTKLEDSAPQQPEIRQEPALSKLSIEPEPVSPQPAAEQELTIQSPVPTEYVCGLGAEESEGNPVMFFALIAAVWYLICAGVVFGFIS